MSKITQIMRDCALVSLRGDACGPFLAQLLQSLENGDFSGVFYCALAC